MPNSKFVLTPHSNYIYINQTYKFALYILDLYAMEKYKHV